MVNPFEVVKVTLQTNQNAFTEVGKLLHSPFSTLLGIITYETSLLLAQTGKLLYKKYIDNLNSCSTSEFC